MDLPDNTNQLFGDDLKQALRPGARLKIAASCFSMYAFEALRSELEHIDELQFIFTAPTFVADEVSDKIRKERKEFHIPKLDRERSLYGSEFEVQLRNQLTQRAIARECAEWLQRKARFKSNRSKAQMQQFACVQADGDTAYSPLHGFTAVDQKVYAPKNSADWFSEDHDYVLVYARNKSEWRPQQLARTPEMEARYKNPDNDPRGPWKAADMSARNRYDAGVYAVTYPSGRQLAGPPTGRYWVIDEDKFKALDADKRIWWGTDGNNVPGEDLLFQVMLDWGVDLALPIARDTIQGKEVLHVDGNGLMACFDAAGGVDEALVKEMVKAQPLRVVFRDAGFRDSAMKINVEQIFRQLSPGTEVKCL